MAVYYPKRNKPPFTKSADVCPQCGGNGRMSKPVRCPHHMVYGDNTTTCNNCGGMGWVNIVIDEDVIPEEGKELAKRILDRKKGE